MQIVIDIPETMLDWLKNGYPNEDDMDKLLDLVLNGTPLPKTYDVSQMMYEIYMEGVNMSGEYHGCWVRFKDIEKVVDKYVRGER